MRFVLQPSDVNYPHPATAPVNVLWSNVMSSTRRPGNSLPHCCCCCYCIY